MDIVKFIGNKIKEHRTNSNYGKGMNQSELGIMIGVGPHTISKWESGKTGITTKYLFKLSKALNIEITNFLPKKIVTKDDKINDILSELEDLDEKDLIFIKEIIILKKKLNQQTGSN